jgi:hypothetical protein
VVAGVDSDRVEKFKERRKKSTESDPEKNTETLN